MALTNEVATVSNASIAGARITNCARSNNATVNIVFKFHICFHESGTALVTKFHDAVEKYIHDHPEAWDSLLFFRCEDIDADNEFVNYRLAVRSYHTWQVATRVTTDRGLLHQHCIQLARDMGVSFDSPPAQQIMYYGGKLKNSVAQKNKRKMVMDPANLQEPTSAGPFSLE